MTPVSSKGKLHAGVLVVLIAVMCTALYVSPTGKQLRHEISESIPFLAEAKTRPPGSPAPKPRPEAVPVAALASPSTAAPEQQDDIAKPPASLETPVPRPRPVTPSPSPAPRGPRIEGCWSFTYQQDAQDVYAADLSDPYGLDGPKGPANGDGLACTHLPRDPSRAASIAVGAYQRTVLTKAQVLGIEKKHFGVAEDGLPGDTGLLDKLAQQVGKAPSMIEWFSTWDEGYTASKVDTSWDRGALPVITWMPAHKGNKNPADISLQRIVDGDWDDYVTTYAKAVVAAGDPVVIRFAHESNGNWYPWSAGGNRAFERGANDEPFVNTPALYRAAWKRVWTIFEASGANDKVIWTWAPVRTDDVNPNLTDRSKASYGLSSFADSYPGDKYVDWVGLSAYSYKGSSWSYATTFARSLAELTAVAPDKPILIAETGASENSGSQSNATRKPLWITDTLSGLAADPRVIGFVWFNNTVVDVHTIDGIKITTDNKWDSSPASLQAFVDQIARPVWLTGTSADPAVAAATRPVP